MSKWSDLKFTPAELEAKDIIGLDDCPQLSADEMKERLDSGDVRERLNALLDVLDETLG